MKDVTKILYTVDGYNKDENVLLVTIKDEGKIAIRLMKPYPQTPEELDQLVRQMAMPLEVAQALQMPPGDLGYIEDLIGKERETTRKPFNERNN